MAIVNDMSAYVPPIAIHREGDADSDGDWYEEITDDGFDSSEMNREHSNRCSLFQTIGYRDGLIAGKEAAAQQGFNTGFLQSVSAGHSWGYVRGITSAFASLPESLKDKLAGSLEAKSRLKFLGESAQGISTDDALKFFHVSCLDRMLQQQRSSESKSSSASAAASGVESDRDQLAKLSEDLRSVLLETTAIKVHSELLARGV